MIVEYFQLKTISDGTMKFGCHKSILAKEKQLTLTNWHSSPRSANKKRKKKNTTVA